MNVPKEKDRILTYLFDKGKAGQESDDIARELNLPHYTIAALCEQMANNDGYVKLLEITSVNSHYKEYAVTITESGKHFIKTFGYKKKHRSEWWESVPKRWWPAAVIFAVVIGFLPLYLQYCSKRDQLNSPGGQTMEKPTGDSLSVNKLDSLEE